MPLHTPTKYLNVEDAQIASLVCFAIGVTLVCGLVWLIT